MTESTIHYSEQSFHTEIENEIIYISNNNNNMYITNDSEYNTK